MPPGGHPIHSPAGSRPLAHEGPPTVPLAAVHTAVFTEVPGTEHPPGEAALVALLTHALGQQGDAGLLQSPGVGSSCANQTISLVGFQPESPQKAAWDSQGLLVVFLTHAPLRRPCSVNGTRRHLPLVTRYLLPVTDLLSVLSSRRRTGTCVHLLQRQVAWSKQVGGARV